MKNGRVSRSERGLLPPAPFAGSFPAASMHRRRREKNEKLGGVTTVSGLRPALSLRSRAALFSRGRGHREVLLLSSLDGSNPSASISSFFLITPTRCYGPVGTRAARRQAVGRCVVNRADERVTVPPPRMRRKEAPTLRSGSDSRSTQRPVWVVHQPAAPRRRETSSLSAHHARPRGAGLL